MDEAMSDDVLIHIGYHKTGTSWLQREVFEGKSRVFRPLNRTPANRTPLSRTFIAGEDGYLLSPYATNEAVSRAWLARHFDERPRDGRVLALSSERLSGNPHAAGFDAPIIARRLHRIFPNAHVLICVREQRAWLLSNYFQYLKAGGSKSFKRYTTQPYDGRRPGFSLHHVDYVPLVTDYFDLFGADNVTVLPYELFKADKAAFLDRVVKPFGRTLDLDAASFERTANATRDEFVWYRLRGLNPLRRSSSVNDHSALMTPATKVVVNGFIRHIGRRLPQRASDSTRAALKREIDALVGDRYESSNKALSALIGVDLSRYSYHS